MNGKIEMRSLFGDDENLMDWKKMWEQAFPKIHNANIGKLIITSTPESIDNFSFIFDMKDVWRPDENTKWEDDIDQYEDWED